MDRICYQVNLQPTIGGGEIYTRSLTRALARLGWRTVLIVARDAHFWPAFMRDCGKDDVEFRSVFDDASLQAALPAERGLIVTHSVLSMEIAPQVAARHCLTGFVHMPLYDRAPRGLTAYRRVFAVSEHVRASAIACGLNNVHPEPLYAVADLASRAADAQACGTLRAASAYDWDTRKLRDRLLGWAEQWVSPVLPRPAFSRRPGLTLGIVSRLTPIKQFPRMFSILAPVLARHPEVHLEIFGSGGYASVRDLKHALEPMRDQVRFWGRQNEVVSVYGQLDYVLSGLPEKEALGLNLIEAQSCGTPVIAVNAPPFTETVVDGEGGYLFDDPRSDGGTDFARLLERLCNGAPRPDPKTSTGLARFSPEAFQARLRAALDAALNQI